MRLLEFVPCGRRGVLIVDDDNAVTTGAHRRTAETAPRPPLPCAGTGGEKRRPRSASGTPASGSWRPSLAAISEDGTVKKAAAAAAAATKISDRRSVRQAVKTPARPKPAAAVRTGGRSDREDYRQFAVPAFAPTAFLF